MSVEMSVVTPISSAAGSPARTTQEIRRRDVGAGSWTPTATSSSRPLRATTTPAATVKATNAANPIDHQRA